MFSFFFFVATHQFDKMHSLFNFYENIPYGLEVMARTQAMGGQTGGWTGVKLYALYYSSIGGGIKRTKKNLLFIPFLKKSV